MKKLGAFVFLLLAGVAHAEERLQTVKIEGLSVPGTPAIGKEIGFTQCEDKYSYYECKRNKPTVIFGVKANSASVFFNGNDNFSSKSNSGSGPKITTVPSENLSYRDIRLDFHLTERDELERALLADGWLKGGSGNSRIYYKDGVAAAFSIHRSLVSIEPVGLTEVKAQIDTLKAKAAEAAKSESASTSFIDAMKK